MSSVDPEGALAMYSQGGEWEKCLELAEKQGGAVLDKYVALYAAELIKTNAPLSALRLFAKHGAPPNPQVTKLVLNLLIVLYLILCIEHLV